MHGTVEAIDRADCIIMSQGGPLIGVPTVHGDSADPVYMMCGRWMHHLKA